MAQNKKWALLDFQQSLQELMSAKGVTDVELAKILKRDRKTIWAWRNGVQNPNIVDFMQICAYLKVEPDILYYGRKVTR